MTLSSEYAIHLQSLYGTWMFGLTFTIVLIYCGGAFPVLIALIAAVMIAFVYRRFINVLLPVPSNAAVIITGCSTGIGADAAKRLSSAGFLVFATVRKAADADPLRRHSERIIPVILDVTDDTAMTAAVKTVIERLSRDDSRLVAVVANAGYAMTGAVELITLDALRKQYETNVFGAVSTVQAFLPLLRASRLSNYHPRVVIISSVLGRMTTGGNAVYASTKYALEAIGNGFRQELRHFNIEVALVEPGFVRTQFMSKSAANGRETQRRAVDVRKETLDNDVLAFYDRAFESMQAFATRMGGWDTSFTSDAIESAIRDSRPLARYHAGFDAMMGLSVFSFLPTEIQDIVLAKAYVM